MLGTTGLALATSPWYFELDCSSHFKHLAVIVRYWSFKAVSVHKPEPQYQYHFQINLNNNSVKEEDDTYDTQQLL